MFDATHVLFVPVLTVHELHQRRRVAGRAAIAARLPKSMIRALSLGVELRIIAAVQSTDGHIADADVGDRARADYRTLRRNAAASRECSKGDLGAPFERATLLGGLTHSNRYVRAFVAAPVDYLGQGNILGVTPSTASMTSSASIPAFLAAGTVDETRLILQPLLSRVPIPT